MHSRIDPITFTDTGNAEALVKGHGEDFRYLSETREFYVYNGRFWQPDKNASTLFRWSKDVIKHFKNTIPDIVDHQNKECLESLDWAIKSASKARRSSMIDLARHEEGVTVSIKSFDRDPYLLNLNNGTLDLRTAKLRHHSREDFITKIVSVDYDPEASCPQFLEFLRQVIPTEDTLKFLQRSLGYSLTGSTKEHVLFILYGSGRNGKSTLLNLIRNILNNYAKDTDPETFFNKNHSPTRNDLARLAGSRLVTTTEGEEGKSLSESLVKKITGGDPLVARFLFREFFQFIPEFKIFLATNHKPKIRGTDHAIWSRIKLIPFNVVIPESEINHDLPDQLRDEAPGIVNWLVEGCQEWQNHGLGDAAEVTEATQNYRNDLDTVSNFLTQECVEDENAQEIFGAIYANYENWCSSNGDRAESKKKFSTLLQAKGIQTGRNSTTRFVRGIGLIKNSN